MSEIKKFKNKEEALECLVEIMPIDEMQQKKYLILAISYQGVWFAQKFSEILQAPFDLFFTTPIPAPLNADCSIAMVSETYDLVVHDALIKSFNISNDYVYGEAKRRYEEQILNTIYQFRKGETICSLKDKNIIIVDGGVNSGMTVTAAIKSCMNAHANSISIAAPVIPHDVELLLRDIADHIYTVLRPLHFMEIENYYEEYNVLSAEEIENLLERIRVEYNI